METIPPDLGSLHVVIEVSEHQVEVVEDNRRFPFGLRLEERPAGRLAVEEPADLASRSGGTLLPLESLPLDRRSEAFEEEDGCLGLVPSGGTGGPLQGTHPWTTSFQTGRIQVPSLARRPEV